MGASHKIILRAEEKPLEHRSLLTPSAVTSLIEAGYEIQCETCEQRCFSDEEMAAAGASLVPKGSWRDASLDHLILGLKELNSEDNFPLQHTHLHFAHVFKGQPGWQKVVSRFSRGGGSLLDIEFLPDPEISGRLLNPSSFHAGFCGTVLALQGWARQITHPDSSFDEEAQEYYSEDEAVNTTAACLQDVFQKVNRFPVAMIIGASGKCGKGAINLCQRLDFRPENIIQCGRAETSDPNFRDRLLEADVVINCIYLADGTQPFITSKDLGKPDRRLAVIADVSCDGDDLSNPIAIYKGHTTFKRPYMSIPTERGPPMLVVAIDHLPSLIPRSASEYCAEQLLPSLLRLGAWETAAEWQMARETFARKLQEVKASSSSRSSSQHSALGHSNTSDSDDDRSSVSIPSSADSIKESKLERAMEEPTVSAVMDESLKPQPEDSFDTAVVHAGHKPHDPYTGAVSMPITMSSTYAQTNASHIAGDYVYSRKANPNRSDFERSIAVLEKAEYGLAFSSGSAAIAMIVNLLDPHSNIIALSDVYAGTHRTFTIMAESLQISTTYVDGPELEHDLGKHLTAQSKMIWIETPSNPLLQVVDLEAITQQAHRHGILVVVDNTLASPYIVTPLTHGADIVVHSVTKHLAGHSDLVIGALATNSAKLHSRLAFLQNALGAVPSPFDCWLASRGLRTFHLRGHRANANGQAVAEALDKSPHVISVLYPGLDSHPKRATIMKQHKHNGAGGGIVSFRIRGGFTAAENFCRSVRLFTLAESFGSVQSLCEVPGPMTHKLMTSEQRAAIGVHDDLVRLSMGIEAPEDLVTDVLLALEIVCGGSTE